MKYLKKFTPVPTFVPANWIIQKNYLFDPNSIDINFFNEDESFFVENEVLRPSLLFASTNNLSGAEKGLIANLYAGTNMSESKIVYDLQFSIHAKKQKIHHVVEENIDNIFILASKISQHMINWAFDYEFTLDQIKEIEKSFN